MTVSELIEKLKELPGEFLVATYDGGEFADLRWPAFDRVRIREFYGEPMRDWDEGQPDSQPAVVL